MSTYTDRSGNAREISITIDAVERCRSRLGVDLYDITSVGDCTSDVLSTMRLIHCIQNPPESLNDWFSLHTGDVAELAASAFLETLLDFFPTRLANLLKTQTELVSQATEAAYGYAERSSGNLPDSSELIQAG